MRIPGGVDIELEHARHDIELVREATPAFSREAFLAGKQTPVFQCDFGKLGIQIGGPNWLGYLVSGFVGACVLILATRLIYPDRWRT